MNQIKKTRARRSLIFVPGLKPDLVARAIASGADAVCVDLEDAVAPKDKHTARERTVALMKNDAFRPDASGVELIVRINPTDSETGRDDLNALTCEGMLPVSLMLPKVASPEEILRVDEYLGARQCENHLQVIIETCAGLEAVHDIASASARLDALIFGGVDMAAELGCKNQWEPLLYARSRVVHGAAGAGIDAIDVPSLDLNDQQGMEEEARRARDLGFIGKAAIHPKQVPVINSVFTPSVEEVERAKQIISGFESAEKGVVVIDGKLIERPVLREMQRILAVAEKVKQ